MILKVILKGKLNLHSESKISSKPQTSTHGHRLASWIRPLYDFLLTFIVCVCKFVSKEFEMSVRNTVHNSETIYVTRPARTGMWAQTTPYHITGHVKQIFAFYNLCCILNV